MAKKDINCFLTNSFLVWVKQYNKETEELKKQFRYRK
jgi:hypothetical protein